MSGNQRLRIAVVTDVYEGSSNGAAISTQRFVETLRLEHEVTVITAGEPGPGRVVLPRFYVPGGGEVMKKMGFPFAWPQTAVLREGLAGHDVVHVQFPFWLGIKSISLARKLRLPVVSSFHVQAEHIAYNLKIRSPWVVDQIYRFFVSTCYNRTDAVVCPSRFAQNEITRHGLRVPSRVISNGVAPQFRPQPVERPPAVRDRFVILTVGRLAQEKRHEVLIEAVRRSRHRDRIQLVILGRGPRREELVQLGATLPHPPIFDLVPQAEIPRWYNQADLYVHASEVEIECLTVLEGMACGLTPVIADSAKSATPQFALDERALFRCNDAQDLAAKIDYWIEHPAQLADANRRYLESANDYRLEESARKLVALYREVLEKDGSGPAGPLPS